MIGEACPCTSGVTSHDLCESNSQTLGMPNCRRTCCFRQFARNPRLRIACKKALIVGHACNPVKFRINGMQPACSLSRSVQTPRKAQMSVGGRNHPFGRGHVHATWHCWHKVWKHYWEHHMTELILASNTESDLTILQIECCNEATKKAVTQNKALSID